MGSMLSGEEPQIYKPKLKNAILMHNIYPNTFQIPTNNEINDLNIGDYVIVYNSNTSEYFWVKLGNTYSINMIGKIYNDLTKNSEYTRGNLIYLKRKNIYRISKQKYTNLY